MHNNNKGGYGGLACIASSWRLKVKVAKISARRRTDDMRSSRAGRAARARRALKLKC